MANRLRNQINLLDEEKLAKTSFVVVGSGAIGSYFVTTLAKMGAKNITVYDHDSIEDHNIANQMYPITKIGESKVSALKDVTLSYSGEFIKVVNEKWSIENAVDADIVVSAVDNMDVRKEIWDYYTGREGIKFFLDGRMGGQVYRVYGVDFSNSNAYYYYESTLYPQSEATPERCGQKSIIYTVLGVSSQMLAQVKRFLMNEYRPTEVIVDMLNDEITKKYHQERVYEEIEVD